MGNSTTPAITITISGGPGAGKSTLINEIGHLLKIRGFNVRCIERISHRGSTEQYECPPNQQFIDRPIKPDNRLIEVVAQN